MAFSYTMDKLSLNDNHCLEVFSNSLVMTNIVSHVSCFDIQRLRKVCRGIRNCMDIIKPDPRIESILIKAMHIDEFDLDINIANESIRIEYNDYECCILRVPGRILRKCVNKSFDQALCDDFEATLRNQKSILKEIRFEFSYESYFQEKKFGSRDTYVNLKLLKTTTSDFLDLFNKNLKHLQFRVEKLFFETTCQDELLEILPLLDSNSLKSIELQYPFGRKHESFIEIDQVAKSEQWQNAEKLETHTFSIKTPIKEMNLTHFSSVDIRVDFITNDDVLFLKKNLLKSLFLKKWKIFFNFSNWSADLEQTLGLSYFQQDDAIANRRKTWYFQIADTEMILFVLYYVSHSFTFSRVHSSSIPNDAVIQ